MTTRLTLAIVLCVFTSWSMFAAQSPLWPVGRARHHVAYDPTAQVMLMLNGAQASVQAGRDTVLWAWNGATWRALPGIPQQRANEAVAFDSARGRLVVHGGSSLDGRGSSMTRGSSTALGGRWSALPDQAPAPITRWCSTRPDSRRSCSETATDAIANDTWAWDGQVWKRLANDGPPRRGVQAIGYDPKRRVVVMFGGVGGSNAILNDTWEWDGRQWKQIATATAPSPRFDTNMSYDPGGSRLILFGGRERLANIGDTWGYDGLAWTRIDTAGPSARNGHAMVYDPRAKAILLFGGRNAPAYFNDLWAFDGGWRQIPQR